MCASVAEFIRGGRASITMGGSDVSRMEKERNELVNVLKTGSLPAPLHEESSSEVGSRQSIWMCAGPGSDFPSC